MRKEFWKGFLTTVVFVLALAASAVWISQAQTGGLRRETGVIFTEGFYKEFTAGAAIAANEAVFLDSAGKVQKAAITGQTTTLIGVAKLACANAATDCRVIMVGTATAIADAAITIGDRVGAPTTTAGRVLKVVPTFVNGTGATTVVMGTTNPVTNPGASLILGRALTAAAAAGDTFTMFVGIQ